MWTGIGVNANGGTELMAKELERRLPQALLDEFQIFLPRSRAADAEKIRILWCHNDFAGPEAAHLTNGRWRRFHRIVFVSRAQAQAFVERHGIPWSRCHVLPNAITPIAVPTRRLHGAGRDRPIRLIYTPVPNRGLDILLAAFTTLCEQRDDVRLDVFSSFRLYGWDEEDEPMRDLFDALREHPSITYHGAVPNRQLRRALAAADIFAYPSTWPETSCRCLMEAMSAGLACVHPNIAALPETAAGQTMMYQWHPDPELHADIFRRALLTAVDAIKAGHPLMRARLAAQKTYADTYYSWEVRAWQWEDFLRGLVNLPRRIQTTT